MPRSPLACFLKEAYMVAGAALGRRTTVERILQQRYQMRSGKQKAEKKKIVNRNNSAKLKANLRKYSIEDNEIDPKIAIVGGGLAGLTCAYRLKQAGFKAEIYEATERVGGRCWTRRGDFDEGQIVERGGELIDTDHAAIRELAEELGLTLDDLILSEKIDTEPFYFFDGAPYTFNEAAKILWGSSTNYKQILQRPVIRHCITDLPGVVLNWIICPL